MFEKAQNINKLISYSFCLSTYTGPALLDTGANWCLVDTCFTWLAKLHLGPSWAQKIKVADRRMLPVKHKILLLSIIMVTITSTLRAPVTNFRVLISALNSSGFGKKAPRQLGHVYPHFPTQGGSPQGLSGNRGSDDEGPNLCMYYRDAEGTRWCEKNWLQYLHLWANTFYNTEASPS